MVGTAEKYVGRAWRTRAKNVAGSNRPAMVTWPPAISGASVPTTIPLTWNRGRISRLLSAEVRSSASITDRHIALRFA